MNYKIVTPKIGWLLILCIGFFTTSCEKTLFDEDYAGKNNNYYSTTAQITFYTGLNTSPISVFVDGVYQGTITVYYSSGSPNCGDAGNVSITVDNSISHSWYAYNSTYVWGSSISPNIIPAFSNSCFVEQLY